MGDLSLAKDLLVELNNEKLTFITVSDEGIDTKNGFDSYLTDEGVRKAEYFLNSRWKRFFIDSIELIKKIVIDLEPIRQKNV